MDDLDNDRFAPLTEAELAPVPAGADAAQDDNECVRPIPADAPPMLLAHPKWGAPTARWSYRDASGALLFEVWRLDPDGERKQFLPLSLWRDGRQLQWRWKGLPVPRPLYQLDRLAANPDTSVVICEGEKSADAAARDFANSVCTTSPNGSQAASNADWTPLAGRRVNDLA